MGSRNPYIPSTYVREPQICDIAYFYSVVSWISPIFLYYLFICFISVSLLCFFTLVDLSFNINFRLLLIGFLGTRKRARPVPASYRL